MTGLVILTAALTVVLLMHNVAPEWATMLVAAIVIVGFCWVLRESA
jgi:hypothetical protein